MHPSSNCAQVCTVLGVCYQSYAVPRKAALIWHWNQNFPRTAGLTFNAFHDWNIEQIDSVPTFVHQMQAGCELITSKIHLSTEWDRFFWEFDRLFFLKVSGRESKQSRLFSTGYLTNTLIHSTFEMFTPSTPSWHKWSDSEHRPWCLVILSVNIQWNEVEARLDCFFI